LNIETLISKADIAQLQPQNVLIQRCVINISLKQCFANHSQFIQTANLPAVPNCTKRQVETTIMLVYECTHTTLSIRLT